MSDSEIIKLIRGGEHSGALDCLYKNYPAFKNTFIKAGGNNANAGDIFQEALLIFIQKVSNEQFKLTCSVNGFLFGICRNLSHEYFRNKNKTVSFEIGGLEDSYELDNIDSFIEEERKFSALDNALLRIGKQCIEILNMFYNQDLSMALIAEKIGFKSELSAKTQKYKCIEKARNLTIDVLSELKTELA